MPCVLENANLVINPNWAVDAFNNYILEILGKLKLQNVHIDSGISYTECPRRNVKYFGRVFLMINYTDITQNTYIQSWTVTEIMAREVWNFDSC